MALYRQALAVQPKFWRANVNLAYLEYARGNYPEAARYYPSPAPPTLRTETNSSTSECRCCEWAGLKRRRMRFARRCWCAPTAKPITWGWEWFCGEREAG